VLVAFSSWLVRSVSPFCIAAALLPQGPSAALADFRPAAIAVDGRDYAYQVLEPLPELRGQPQPLLVFLHGSGERGRDNQEQLRWLPELMAEPSRRRSLPCFVLALQCPADETWVEVEWEQAQNQPMLPQPTRSLRAVLAAIDMVLARPGVDPARVYLVGLSMGGFGAMDLAARAPDRFAAVMALCGGGDAARMPSLVGMPLQIWHGAQDRVVPVERSRSLVAALRVAGAAVDYRELEQVGHDVWLQAFGAGGGLPWLFQQDQRQQQRGIAARPPLVPSAEEIALGSGTFRLQASSRCVVHAPVGQAPERLVAAIAASCGRQLALVRNGEPGRADIVFKLDPEAAAPFVLEIDERCVILARDADGADAAAAAVAQALQAIPGGGCPEARIVRRRDLGTGRVVLPGNGNAWPIEDIEASLRWCWLFGARELAIDPFGRPAAMPDATWRQLGATAERWGVRLVSGEDAPPKGALVVAGRDAESIWQLPRIADGPQPFLLQLSPVPAGLRLPALVAQLATTAERAASGAATVRAVFRARLGQLLRQG
jgi:predicted esterase